MARPFSEQIGQKPVQAVLLLDGSASMQARTSSPRASPGPSTRRAVTLAGLPENSLATAILVAAHPQVLVAATSDRRQVDRALSEAQPSGAAADMREALLLARSLGGDPGARRIYLFTDGAFTLPPDLPDDLGSVDVVPVGQPEHGNLAVTAISTRPDPRDNRRQQLFTRVENFSPTPPRRSLRSRSTARRSRSAASTWRPTARPSRSSRSFPPARAGRVSPSPTSAATTA